MDLTDLMRDLATRLDDLEDRLATLIEDGAWLAALELYAEFDGLRSAMGRRNGDLAAMVAEAMPSETAEVPGLGVVQRRRGTDRKAWRWEELLPHTMRAYLDPEGTGEFPSDPHVAAGRVRAMAEEVIGLTPSKGPRVTALRAIDLDPDEFCTTTPGRLSVQITRNEEVR